MSRPELRRQLADARAEISRQAATIAQLTAEVATRKRHAEMAVALLSDEALAVLAKQIDDKIGASRDDEDL